MEQKAAHTPAPWLIEWNAAQSGEGHYITDSKDMVELSRIAAVLFHDDADGETRANARLLAAAPELLEACKRMIEWTTVRTIMRWISVRAWRFVTRPSTQHAPPLPRQKAVQHEHHPNQAPLHRRRTV